MAANDPDPGNRDWAQSQLNAGAFYRNTNLPSSCGYLDYNDELPDGMGYTVGDMAGAEPFDIDTYDTPLSASIPDAIGVRVNSSAGAGPGYSASADVVLSDDGLNAYSSIEGDVGPQAQAGKSAQAIVAWNVPKPGDYAGDYSAVNVSLKVGGGVSISLARSVNPSCNGYHAYVLTIGPTAGIGGGGSLGKGTTYKIN